MKIKKLLVVLFGLFGIVHADFVAIGNAGNTADTTGYGAVGYSYQIAKYETTIAQWAAFYNDASSGKVGLFNSTYSYWNDGSRTLGTNAPAIRISFHQAAQYCNWLTTGSATNGAYTVNESGTITAIDRTFRNAQDVLYVIPTENEWYKAAYFKTDASGYSLYANGTDTAPNQGVTTGWNFNNAVGTPWVVGSGAIEQNGTYDIMGNVWEWMEWSLSGNGIRRGGRESSDETVLKSSLRTGTLPSNEPSDLGFRVVAIPEPASAMMLIFGAGVGMAIHRARRWANR
jgi:formylglycine-generating enzyme required for sulfatase activity